MHRAAEIGSETDLDGGPLQPVQRRIDERRRRPVGLVSTPYLSSRDPLAPPCRGETGKADAEQSQTAGLGSSRDAGSLCDAGGRAAFNGDRFGVPVAAFCRRSVTTWKEKRGPVPGSLKEIMNRVAIGGGKPNAVPAAL